MKMRWGVVLGALALAGEGAWAGGGKIQWEGNFKKGLAAAKNSGRPIALYFTADW